MGWFADVRSEIAWRQALPLIKATPPRARFSLAHQIAVKGTSSTTFSLSNIDTDWYQREGYDLLSRALGGYSSYSGQAVTVEAAFESTAFYAGVKIISEDTGRLPNVLYRKRDGGRGEDPAKDHPVYPVLKNLWNPDIAAGEGTEALTAHALIAGTGFAQKERDGRGKLQWLFPLQPENVRVDKTRGGRVVYLIRKESGLREQTIIAEDVFRLTGFTLNGILGDEILKRARHALGLTLSAQEYAARWFKNDASVGLILKRPIEAPTIDDEGIQELKKQFKEWHQGLANVGLPAILQEGTTVERIVPDPEKTQLVEQRKFQLLEVCRLLRMKPHKLADLERATHSNIEEENIDYIVHTIGPWVKRWRNAVFRDLLTREEQIEDRLFAEMNVEAFLQGNFEKQANGISKLLEKGVYSINEARELLHFNPVDGGDKHYIQLNMQSVADAATGTVQDQGSKLVNVGPGYVNGKGVEHASDTIT